MKKYKKERLTIKNFSPMINTKANKFDLKQEETISTFNFMVDKGVLKKSCGAEELTLPQHKTSLQELRKLNYSGSIRFTKLWRYKFFSKHNQDYEYALIALGSDNVIYFINMFGYDDTIYTLNEFVFQETPNAITFRVNGEDVIGFCSPSDSLMVWYCDKMPYQVESAPKFSSICLHNQRLFAIDSEKNYLVRYSSNLNPLDWSTSSVSVTSAGSIELNDYKGSLKNLISFQDNVFVFRDFGISKISSYSNYSKFSATNIFNSSAKVFCNTATICGTDIFFLCEDGLYKFDGFNVEKFDDSFAKVFTKNNEQTANTTYFNGKLYIACSLNFNDNLTIGCEREIDHKNNCLIIYDIQTKSYTITRGIDISCMLGIKDEIISKLILSLNTSLGTKLWQLTENGLLGEEVLPKVWVGGNLTLGEFDKNKILKEVNLISKTDCTLIVSTDKTSKEYPIKADENLQRVRINLTGKFFSFKFLSTSENPYISTPQFVFNVEE